MKTTLIAGVLFSILCLVLYREADIAVSFFLGALAGALLLGSWSVIAKVLNPQIDSQEKMYYGIAGGALNLIVLVGMVLLAKYMNAIAAGCGFSLFLIVIVLKALTRVMLGMPGLENQTPDNGAGSNG